MIRQWEARARSRIVRLLVECVGLPFNRLSVVQRENVYFSHEILNKLGIIGKSRESFEAKVASATMPKMTNKLIFQIFRFFRGNEFVATPNASYAEHGTRVEHLRHN